MEFRILQSQYNNLHSYFKTTCEPFDFLEWDGKTLNVWNRNKIIETYNYRDLKALNIFQT